MAADLGPGVGAPDLHEVVGRPANDEIAVPRESDRFHQRSVTRERAHLPPPAIFSDHFQGKLRGERRMQTLP